MRDEERCFCLIEYLSKTQPSISYMQLKVSSFEYSEDSRLGKKSQRATITCKSKKSAHLVFILFFVCLSIGIVNIDARLISYEYTDLFIRYRI